MFGEGQQGGHGGHVAGKGSGKLLARIGRAATFRAMGEKVEEVEEQGRRRRGWLKHLPLLSKSYNASKNKSEAAAAGGGDGKRSEDHEDEEGRWHGGGGGGGEGVHGRGVHHQGGRLHQLGQKLESSDDSGRESGYTRLPNSLIHSFPHTLFWEYNIISNDQDQLIKISISPLTLFAKLSPSLPPFPLSGGYFFVFSSS